MEKELNLEEYIQEEFKDCVDDVVFYGERAGRMVDLETLILEKLWTYGGVNPSEFNLKDNSDGWKKIASALASALIVDYGIDKSEYEEITKDNGNINYTSLYRSVNTDDPKEVVKRIKTFLTHGELAPEQILFGLGLILDKNKESYITVLKQDLAEMKHQLKEVVNENNKFRERLNKAEKNKAQYPLKKKVVIVRNKVVAE